MRSNGHQLPRLHDPRNKTVLESRIAREPKSGDQSNVVYSPQIALSFVLHYEERDYISFKVKVSPVHHDRVVVVPTALRSAGV